MIAIATPPLPNDSTNARRDRFESMIDAIRDQARFAFRRKLPEEREELIQEVIANAWTAFCRLWSKGKADLAYPTPLADYAIRQVRAGRRVGAPLNSCDASSPYAQKIRGIGMSQLDRFDRETRSWMEAVVEDRRTPVADQVAFRIDFSAWLAGLSRMKRKVALELAAGHATSEVAGLYGVTAGRISQVRRELDDSWDRFQGESSTSGGRR